MTQIERARHIAATFGTYKAARFLSSRGWSIEAALHILITSQPMRDRHEKRIQRKASRN